MNQWKRRMGESLGNFYMWNFQLSSLHEVMDNVKYQSNMCDDIWTIANKYTKTLDSSFGGLGLLNLVGHLHGWPQSLAITLNHTVPVWHSPKAPGKQRQVDQAQCSNTLEIIFKNLRTSPWIRLIIYHRSNFSNSTQVLYFDYCKTRLCSNSINIYPMLISSFFLLF